MEKVTGKQVAAMIESGNVSLSDDRMYILSKDTNEKLAKRIKSEDGVDYFKAYGDEHLTRAGGEGKVEVCVEWEWDENLKIKICVSWSS
ncbi:MAG: hypothetical protein KBC56_02685 [Flavobacterium sp.]|nr:hypothetical protein [Flavobacterium sp.]